MSYIKTKVSHSRFIYITEVDLSIDNGPGVNEREFVNALLKDYGDEVICMAPYPTHPEIYFDSKLEYVINCRVFHPKLYWPLYCVYLISTLTRVFRLHQRYNVSGLVFRSGETPIAPFLLSRFLKLPLILKTLARHSFYSERLSWKGKIFRELLLPLNRITIQRTLSADTVSIPYKDWLNSKFGISKDRLFLIPNGVNIEHFSPGDQKTSRSKVNLDHFDVIIGYIGALSKNRNLEILIRSLKLIRRDGNIGLVFVGDGASRAALEELAQEEGVAEQVVFTGHVPYSIIPDYMRAFDIAVDLTLVQMKIEGEVSNASYSQKIPQYLACGLPVVAWDVVDNQFLKREGIGEVVPFGVVARLAESLSRLLNLDADLKNSMRQRAIAYAQTELSISKLAAQRLEMWRYVVAQERKFGGMRKQRLFSSSYRQDRP